MIILKRGNLKEGPQRGCSGLGGGCCQPLLRIRGWRVPSVEESRFLKNFVNIIQSTGLQSTGDGVDQA